MRCACGQKWHAGLSCPMPCRRHLEAAFPPASPLSRALRSSRPRLSSSPRRRPSIRRARKPTSSPKAAIDPCVGIRAVPVGEAMMAIVLADAGAAPSGAGRLVSSAPAARSVRMKTALIVIDMQLAWFSAAASRADFTRLVARVNQLSALVRQANGNVIYIQHEGPEGDPFHPDQPGWHLLPELAVEPKDIFVGKNPATHSGHGA